MKKARFSTDTHHREVHPTKGVRWISFKRLKFMGRM